MIATQTKHHPAKGRQMIATQTKHHPVFLAKFALNPVDFATLL